MIETAQQKYSKDKEFREPVLRCDQCQALLLLTDLHKRGMCIHCGSTKVRNVRVMNDDDMKQVTEWAESGEIDRDWLLLFDGGDI